MLNKKWVLFELVTYGNNGDKVINVYVDNKDKDRDTVIKLMEKKI